MDGIVGQAVEQTGLSVRNFAALVGLEPERLERLVGAQDEPSADELERVACALGVDLSELFRGELGVSAVLFRHVRGDVELHDILASGDGLALGAFVRGVRRVRGLREALGEPLASWAKVEACGPAPLDAAQRAYVQGEALAEQARAHLGLDPVEPVASMRALLEGCGVEVVALEPGQLYANIAGACVALPSPAILVNAAGGAPWLQRTTMAHELCHVLFDRDVLGSDGRMFLVSPQSEARRGSKGARWALFDGYLRREQRANAFAVSFLAPRVGVRRWVSACGVMPDSQGAMDAVMGRFGIGHQAAAHVLCNAFDLDPVTRGAMLRKASAVKAFVYDELSAEHALSAVVRRFALRAYAAGHMDAVRVRYVLGLSMEEALPDIEGVVLSDAQRAPLARAENRIRRCATQLLSDRYPHNRALYARDVRYDAETGQWRVSVFERGERDVSPRAAGVLVFGADGAPKRDAVDG